MGRENRRFKTTRLAGLSLLVLLLAGCESISNGGFFDSFKRQSTPADSITLSEQALGKLAKGELLAAQALFDKSLRTNPRDVHALIGKALIFQQTGQLEQAKASYEAVLAMRPDERQKLVIWNNLRAQSVTDLARINLALMQGGSSPQGQNRAPALGAPPMTQPPMAPRSAAPAMAAPSAASVRASEGEANTISRFVTLRRLRDDGLITPQEFAVRRTANVGALLPLTKPAPAAGLDRPVPDTQQITQRLQAIRRALELRAITVRQHGAERTTIIDGLLPASRSIRAVPVPAPKDLLVAADQVRKLELLREGKLITPAEDAAERKAIEAAIQPKASAAAKKSSPANSTASSSKSGAGVHIASYRSKRAADRGWSQLRRAHRLQLGTLSHQVVQVNLGPGKGVFHRLVAGPLPNQARATQVCRELKRVRQFCQPTSFGR
ncbi:MAG: SPOR domain-containing protein [Proteobacteria bacterium]|nr:SPOR domain-containing protein [Pseudomonadota bacterium]